MSDNGFTPYINKKLMQDIMKRVRDEFTSAEIDEVTYLRDTQIEYCGWQMNFSGTITNGVIDLDEITFSPIFRENNEQLIGL